MAVLRRITVPRLRDRRPVPHPLALPRRYTRGLPPTVLDRQRRLAERRRGGPTPLAAAVQRGAARVADAIRARLLALRAGLLALRRKLTTITRAPRAGAR
ncbi:MAG TPA: hypothetical protein VGJ78_21290 [Vicinamibacterales bacterium]